MAKFRQQTIAGKNETWSGFLAQYASPNQTQFEPDSERVAKYESVYQRYKKLVAAHPAIDEALS